MKHKTLSQLKDFSDYILKDEPREFISSDVASINILFSGSPFGGIEKGVVNMISADSSLGKSLIGMKFLKNAQKAGMDCYVIDSEKAFNKKTAESFGVDTSEDALTVFQITDTVEIKKLLSILAEDRSREERKNTFIILDSWGALTTPVILKKAEEGSETQDMSKPRWLNDLATILNAYDQTIFVVNHVYSNTGGFGDPFSVPGGKRLYFVSQNIVLAMSKAKDKDSSGEVSGAVMTAISKKGRNSKENIKLKYRIKHNGGLDPWYGLLEPAMEGGYVIKPKNGKYSRAFMTDDKEWKEDDLYCSEFWKPLFKETDFEQYLIKQYTYENNKSTDNLEEEENEDD